MGQHKNQAKRVVDHITEKLDMSAAEVKRFFKIDVAAMEERIEKSVKQSGMNGKQVADAIIKLWDESLPRDASTGSA